MLGWLFGGGEDEQRRTIYLLRQELAALHDEVRRLTRKLDLAEARERNGLELAQSWQEQASKLKWAYELAKSRTSTPSELELDGREDALYRRHVELRNATRALEDQVTPPMVEGLSRD